jgi:hypothetical protein
MARLRLRSGSHRGKTAASARALTPTGAAGAIRTPVNNRVSHELIRTPVANHRRPRSDRLRRRFMAPVSRCSQSLRRSRATVAPREPVRPEVTTDRQGEGEG